MTTAGLHRLDGPTRRLWPPAPVPSTPVPAAPVPAAAPDPWEAEDRADLLTAARVFAVGLPAIVACVWAAVQIFLT